ncbi:helix-turn-helix domain-containing protein [Ensifer soli]|uniref:helix-turn-helix domain-containing protein n=1 Tax=Ciceribacter sp. sgz301302 TaxID=3342379 RepID=UPI0035B8DC28
MPESTLSKFPPQTPPKKGLQFAKMAQQSADPPYKPGSAHMRSEKQAAAWLGVSKFTLARIRKRGEIGFYKIGGGYQYSIEQLEAYRESLASWPKNGSKSENTSSLSTAVPPSTKPDGLTLKLDKHAAHHYALKTLKKQK